MKELTLESRIEIEIFKLLNTDAQLADVIEELMEKYSQAPLSLPELETLATFFLYSGYYIELNVLLLQQLAKGSKIPWGHLLESIALSTSNISATLKQSLRAGAEEQELTEQLCRSFMFDEDIKEVWQYRETKKKRFFDLNQARCDEMFNNLNVLKIQGLYEEEARLLEKILKLYPQDPRIQHLLEQKRKRQALGLLEKKIAPKPTWIPLKAYTRPNTEERTILKAIETSMFAQFKKGKVDELLAKDFAIAHAMWENEKAALNFLDPLSKDRSILWLRFELLLARRKFIELLADLTHAEGKWDDDPDITYHLLYLKALCFWGLGRAKEAIDLMESISIARPHYRSSLALLAEWKESL